MSVEIRNKIKALPPLPESIARIQELCQDPESGMNDLVKVVQMDPMLTANILKVANSPFYGFSQHVTSISHAVCLFGKAMIRGFAVAATLHRHFPMDLSPYGITGQTLVEISELQRSLVHRWITAVAPESLAVVSPASFMMETGKIIVAQHVLETGREAEFLRDLMEQDDIGAVERHHTGLDSYGITADLFIHWQFEEELVNSIRHIEAPEMAPPEVRNHAWALKMVSTCISVKRRFDAEDVEGACETVASLGLGPAELKAAVSKITESREGLVS